MLSPQNKALVGASAPQRRGHRRWQQGVALSRRNDWRGAARAFRQAADAVPGDTLYWLNLAHAEQHHGDAQAAVEAARRCLALDPAHALAQRLLGEGLAQLHRYEESAASFAALESLGVEDTQAMLRHGSMLQALQRPREAAAVLLRALAREPALARGHALLSDALRDLGLKQEAAECMKTVLALEPGNLEAMSHLSFEKRHVADWRDLDADVRAITRQLAAQPDGLARVCAAFGLLSLPIDPVLQLGAARGESLAFTAGVTPLAPLPSGVPAGSRVVLGFLSYDFREHPVSQLLVELFERLDRSRFEVIVLSCSPDDGSALRRRIEAAADRCVDLRGLSDDEAALRVRSERVELLFDLMGHTRGHRMGILARRPAPLQVAYLGYPGSTGAPFVDYLIGDPLVTPLELAALYSEKLAQLPHTFQPNGRWRPLPQPMTRATAGLPDAAFVMCAFNHTYKILPEAFDAWCGVLREVPHAVLWLKETNGQLHDNLRREAAGRGVDPARILFAKAVPYAEHFSRLALADLFVDTWPYNAHTTAADALWAGVPVVTVYGNGFASRVAASVLDAAGIGELAFETVESYRLAITAFALEPGLLARYREHLNTQRMALPLFDSAGYTRDFEQLLTQMVERHRAGLRPDHLPAARGAAGAAHPAEASVRVPSVSVCTCEAMPPGLRSACTAACAPRISSPRSLEIAT